MRQVLSGARVLTGAGWREDAVVVENGLVVGFGEADVERVELGGGILIPGLIDAQVNGGGGVLFNDSPTVEGIAAIGEAHRRFGTTGFLPTLISDDLEKVGQAIAAVRAAIEAGVPGVLGIHLEGPFLSAERKGIHDAAKFRRIAPEMIDLLASLTNGRTVLTLAPELAPEGMIAALVKRGVIVCAGHSSADYDQTRAALGEGVRGFTHLFNAMTPFGSRAPGMVGAALEDRTAWCGIIVDGFHVHPASLRVALAARGGERFMLVTDAMPTVGGNKSFLLGGREIVAEGGRLAAADATLAGSDLDMASAVRNAVSMLGVPLETAVAMASGSPAAFLGLGDRLGQIAPGMAASLVHMDEALNVKASWIEGRMHVH